MACPINLSMALDCKDAVGGVKTLYLATFPSNGLSYSPTIASGVITAWSSASSKFFTYEVRQGIATGGSKATVSQANGTKVYNPTFTTQLEKITAAKSVELDNVIANRLLVIVRLQDDTYWLMGYKNGMDITEMDTNPGTAMGDFNGYKLTGTGMEPYNWYQVSSGIVAALLA